MKRLAALMIALTLCAPAVFAQNHGEIGAFVDWTRLRHANNTNFFGLGGRVGFNASENVQFEAQMAYDFEQSFTNTGSVSSGFNSTTNLSRTSLRMLHGLFGPKIQTGGGAVRLFATVQGGFLKFSVSNPNTATTTAFSNSVNIFQGDTNGVLYPGGGIEFYAGPIGLRVDVGDEIYFDRGANHNLKFMFGPQFRF